MRLFLVLCAASFVSAPADRGFAADDVPIAPNVEIQAKIDRAVTAMATPSLARLDRLREAETLRPEFVKAPKAFGEQILYYMAQPRDVSRGMAAGSLFAHFYTDKRRMLDVLLPYLDSDGPRFREVKSLVLGWLEDSVGNRPPDFTWYRSIIDEAFRANRDPPPGLVRYMFERSPSDAFAAFLKVAPSDPKRQRERLWAEHVIADTLWKHEHGFLDRDKAEPDAIVQVERLSKDEAWWARLYAAEIVQRHAAFRTPELVKRLSDDPHPLVKEAMGFARESPKDKEPPRVAPPQRPAPARPETK